MKYQSKTPLIIVFLAILAPTPIYSDTIKTIEASTGQTALFSCAAFTGTSNIVSALTLGPDEEDYQTVLSLQNGDLNEVQSQTLSQYDDGFVPTIQSRIYGMDSGNFMFLSQGHVVMQFSYETIYIYEYEEDGFGDSRNLYNEFPNEYNYYFKGADIKFNSDKSKLVLPILSEEEEDNWTLIGYAFNLGQFEPDWALFQQDLGSQTNYIFCDVKGDPMYVGFNAGEFSNELILYRFRFEEEDTISGWWPLSGLSSDLKLQDCVWGANDKFYVYFTNSGAETDDFKNDILYYYETDDSFYPETDQDYQLLPPSEIDFGYLRSVPNRIEVMALESGGAIMTGDFVEQEQDTKSFVWRLDENMLPMARPYGPDMSDFTPETNDQNYGTMDFKDDLVLFSFHDTFSNYINFVQLCETNEDCEDSNYDTGRNYCDPRRKICTKGPCDSDFDCTQFLTAPVCSVTESQCYDIRINFPQNGENVCSDEYLTVQMLFDVPVKATWRILDSDDTNSKVEELEEFLNDEDGHTINVPLDMLTFGKFYELQAQYEEDTATYTLDTIDINMLSNIDSSLGCDCSSANFVNTILRICSTTESWIYVHEVSRCEIIIEAQFSDDVGGPDITWVYGGQTPDGDDTGLNDELESFLEAQTTNYVEISAGYLQPSLTYTFRFNYLDGSGNTLSVEEDVGPIEDVELYRLGDYASGPYAGFCYKSDCSALGASFEYHYQWFVQPILTWCLEDTTLVSYNWKLTEPSNPSTELQEFMDQQSQQILEIPECLLEPDTSYTFHAEVQFDHNGDPIVLDSFDLTTEPLDYQLYLLGGNSYHLPDEDLVINISYPLKGEGCPNDPQIKEELSFQWTCEIENEDDCADFPCTCDDTEGIFNVAHTEVTNLTVPSSYFSLEDWVVIKLVLDDDPFNPLETKTKIKENILEVDLQCVSGKCVKYDQDNEYVFSANPIDDGTLDGEVDREWSIEPSTYPVVDYLDRFKIRSQSTDTFVTVEVDVIVTVGDKSGYKRLTMEPETTPSVSLIIFPTEGVSLIDVFTFDARNFVDADRPLSFDFQYQRVGIDDDFVSFGVLKKKSMMQTKLFGQNPELTINIKALCIDYFGSTSQYIVPVTVTSGSVDVVNQAIESYLSELSVISFYDLDDKFQKYTMAVTQAFNLNKEVIGDEDEICEECSGNGECLTENVQKCTCEEGWGLKNCALTQNQVEALATNLATIIDVLYQDFDITTTNINQLTSVLKMIEESSTITARTLDAMSQAQEILTQILLGTNSRLLQNKDEIPNGFQSIQQLNAHNTHGLSTRILQTDLTFQMSSEQTQSALTVINNLVDYLKDIQCDADEITEYGESIRENIADYASIIAEVNLQELAPGDPAKILTSDNLDILSQRFPECDFEGEILDFGEDSISIQLFRKDDITCNNENSIGVELFAINHNFFNCDSDKIYKNITGLRLTNDTKHVVNPDYTAIIRTAEGVECPNQCDPKDSDGDCQCDDLSLFDVKDQFEALLGASNLYKLGNIDALADWDFYKSATFYILIGVTLITLAYAAFILTKGKETCIVTKVVEKDEASGCERFNAILWSGHPFVNAALYLDNEMSKMLRLMVFYTRFVLFHFYASIFLTEGSDTSVVNSEVNLLPEGNPYFILMPYITIIPLNWVLLVLISQKPQTPDKNGEVLPTQRSTKIRVTIGYIFLVLVMAGSILGSFIIDSQLTSSQKTRVIVLFIQTMIQDMIITPIIAIIEQIFFLSLLLIGKIRKQIKLKNFVAHLLSGNFKKTIGYPTDDDAELEDISVYLGRLCKRRAKNKKPDQSYLERQKEVDIKPEKAPEQAEDILEEEDSEKDASPRKKEIQDLQPKSANRVSMFHHNLNSLKEIRGSVIQSYFEKLGFNFEDFSGTKELNTKGEEKNVDLEHESSNTIDQKSD